MPSAPAFTIAEAAYQTAAPVDTYVLRPNGQPASILDTVFVSRRLRRAVYATTTAKGIQTDLWRVERDGRVGSIASIRWEYEWQSPPGSNAGTAGDGSLKMTNGPIKRLPVVFFMGRVWRVDEFLRKGRGWFPSDSRLFTVGNVEFKWKSGTENSSTSDGQYGRSSTRAYHELWKIWRCVVVNPSNSMANHTTSFETNCNAPMQQGGQTSTVHSPSDPSSSNPAPTPHSLRHMSSIDSFIVAQDFLSPSTSSTRALLAPLLAAPAPPTILARFVPPQLGLTHNELALFPSIFSSPNQDQNRLLLENLLLSAVLVAVNKGEWKNVQSLADREALEAVFVAEAKGELPPYTTRVGQVIRPPPPLNHQMDQIWAQWSLSRSGNRGEEEERDCVRPRTAPQLCLSQNRSQVESDSRSGGRQFHRIAHSMTNRSELSSAAQSQSQSQSHLFAYSPPASTPSRSAPPISFRMRRPSTSDSTSRSNSSGRTAKAGDGIFSGRRPSRSRSRPSTSVGPNEECGPGPEMDAAVNQVRVAGVEGGISQGEFKQGESVDMVELGEKSSLPSSFLPPAYFRSFLD